MQQPCARHFVTRDDENEVRITVGSTVSISCEGTVSGVRYLSID